MRIIIYLLFVTLIFGACQKKVEGCMHPRAENFNPEADTDNGCVYYQLQLQMQHYHSGLANDTLVIGNWIYDADGTAFYLTQFPILMSQLHLFKTGTEDAYISPETIILSDESGLAVYAEDNFFITKPGLYTANITGWTELGSYDSLQFYIGVSDEVRRTDPADVSIGGHPLSVGASYYMYDSTSASYQSSLLKLTQPVTNNSRSISFFDYIPINLPYNAVVTDGSHTSIRLRLDYQALFNGVSFTNDNDATVRAKIIQNFPSAFSTY